MIPLTKNIKWLHITDIDELEAYLSVWKECIKYSKESIFISPQWIIHWKNVFWTKNDSLHLYLAFNDKQCIAFAPFYIKQEAQFPHIKYLHVLGQGEAEALEIASEYPDIFIHPDYHHLIKALANKLTRLNFEKANVTALLEGAHLLTLFSIMDADINEAGIRYSYLAKTNSSPILSKNTKSKLNKCKNKLTTLNAQYIWVEEHEYDKFWSLMENFHQKRWNKLNKNGAFNHPKFSLFHENFRHENSNAIKISAVVVNSVPIAINYYICSDNVLYFYQSGWDEDNYANASPGFALHIWSMSNNSYSLYDYMKGEENNSYKSKLGCNNNIKMHNILLIRSPLKALLAKIVDKIRSKW